MEVNKRKTKKEDFGGIMKLRNKILNWNWSSVITYSFFLVWITSIYSDYFNLIGNTLISEAFLINSKIFLGVQFVAFVFFIIQSYNKHQIKKIIKGNKISVV